MYFSMQIVMNAIAAIVVICTAAILFYYRDPVLFHGRMMEIYDARSDDGTLKALVSLAAVIGQTRLIDNIVL